MSLDIVGGRTQTDRVVAEQSDPTIARSTEKTTYLVGDMVMVDVEEPTLRVIRPADDASMILRFQQPLVLGIVDSVPMPPLAAPFTSLFLRQTTIATSGTPAPFRVGGLGTAGAESSD